jgi:LuxR family maltose regulon positive regulatory protein
MNLYDLDRSMEELNRAEAAVPEPQRARYAGTILSLRGMLEGLTGNIERSIEMLERALTLVDPNDFWYPMTSLHLGVTALMIPDLRKGEQYLGRVATYRDRAEGLMTAVVGESFRALSHLWRGLPDEAIRIARQADGWVAAVDEKHHTGRALSSLTNVVFAEVERLQNNLDRARQFAQEALEFGKQGFQIGYFEASRILTQTAEAQGDWDAALAAANEMVRGCRFTGNPHFLVATEAVRAFVRWRRGKITGKADDVDAVVRMCDELGLLDVDRWRDQMHPGIFNDYPLILATRVLLHQERWDEATRLADALFAEAVGKERVPSQIVLLVLRAQAEAGRGHMDVAVNTMQRALEIASRPRFIRPFLEDGARVLPILERAAARVADRDFALLVLSAFDVPVRIQPLIATGIEPLSDREVEVLRLVAEGESNQSAARRLFVAPSTVKKHLENIYAKLGVGGRTQAVARARELRLL